MSEFEVSAVAEFAAAAATVLAAWQLAPQVSKLRRDASTEGLSPTWALLGVVTNAAWVVYRSSQGLWYGVPSPIIAGVLYAITFMLIGRTICDLRWAVAASAIAIVILVGLGAIEGWAFVGVLLGLSGGAQAAPSVWAAFRADVPAGLAPSVWLIGVGQALMWGLYGSTVGDSALMLYGLTMGAASTAVLARYGLTRDRIARTVSR